MEEKKWNIDSKKWNEAIHIKTNTRYDENGIDKHGFNAEGIHVITGNEYDEDGYNRFGFNANGINKYGFDINGRTYSIKWKSLPNKSYHQLYLKQLFKRLEGLIDILGSNEKEFAMYSEIFPIFIKKQEERVFNEKGIDQFGFNRKGIYVKTNSIVDFHGFNAIGFDVEGYDRAGYDFYGFNKKGYDEYGYNHVGRDKAGYDREGNKKTQKVLTDEEIKNEKKIKEENDKKRRQIYLGLKSKAERLGKGEMSIEEYVKTSKLSIEELIEFAKKDKMDMQIIRGLYKYIGLYKVYKIPFNKEKYLSSTILIINGDEVRPTEEDVDKCISYIKDCDGLVCDKTVKSTVRLYLKGEIDIESKNDTEPDLDEDNVDEKTELISTIVFQQSKIRLQEEEKAQLKTQRRGVDEKQ